MDVLGAHLHVGLEQGGGLPHDAQSDHVEGVAVHHDAHGLSAGKEQLGTKGHAGVGAAAALGADDVVEVDAGLGDLLHAADITQGADGVGAAAGDLVVGPAQLFAHPVHLGVDVIIAVGVHKAHVGVHQVLQQLVALPVGDAPLFQDQDGGHAQLLGAGGGEHGVVGLGAAGGKDDLSPLVLGVGQQELQLADLVAAQTDAGQVVALDPHVGAQDAADVVQTVHGGGQQAQGDAGEFIELFHGSFPFF